jgi:hypothetical protein
MQQSSVFKLFQKMNEENVVLAYRGKITKELLESVYNITDNSLEEKINSPETRKKIFSILVEALQNIFHHQADPANENIPENNQPGFVISRNEQNGTIDYTIITGNYVLNSSVNILKEKLEEINSLSPEEIRSKHRQALSESTFSEKGGAGLGLLEMARKSGNKLNYEFTNIDNQYSFFSLAISIPNKA